MKKLDITEKNFCDITAFWTYLATAVTLAIKACLYVKKHYVGHNAKVICQQNINNKLRPYLKKMFQYTNILDKHNNHGLQMTF